MKNLMKFAVVIFAFGFLSSTIFAQEAQTVQVKQITAQQSNWVDANGDGICDNFGTANQGTGQGTMRMNKGANKGMSDGTGMGNGYGDGTGVRPQDGTGFGRKNGDGTGTGTCDGTGVGSSAGRRGGRNNG